jgi:hypothetical protein
MRYLTFRNDKKKMLRLINIFIVFFTISVAAQEVKKVYDIGGWIGVGVDYKFNKSYTVSFLQEIRLYESFDDIDKVISDIGIVYKINKEFGLGADVRYYLNNHNDNVFTNDFRLSLDFKFKKKVNDILTFRYRLRYQDAYGYFFDGLSTGVVNTFRNKISLSYNLHKHNIYLKTEIFRKREVYRKAYFNKFRLGLGDKFETGLGDFDYSIAYEHELSSKYPLKFLFLRVNYFFKIKK